MVQTGAEESRKAVVKDEVRLNDVINSSKSASLQILLRDQTTFTVGPDCDLVIDEFVYDPNKSDNKLTATVSKGMFRFMSGGISKSNPDSVEVNTPVSSLGIRGTIIEGVIGAEAINMAAAINAIPAGVEIDQAGASLFVLRGPGPNRLGTNNVGRVVVTNEAGSVNVTKVGQAVFVPNKFSAPIVIPSINPATMQSFSSQLRTVPGVGPDTMAFSVSSNVQSLGAVSATSAAGTGLGVTSTGTLLAAGAIAGVVGVVAVVNDDDEAEEEEQPIDPDRPVSP